MSFSFKWNSRLLGRRFGRLIVKEYISQRKNKEIVWLCICDCGKTKLVTSHHLIQGQTKSCGCLQIEVGRRNIYKAIGWNKLPKGEAAFNAVINQYKIRARKSNLSWELEKEQIRKLFYSRCYYCGRLPFKEFLGVVNKYNGGIVYNGIDRLDSLKGYVFNNCVSCCKQCNYAKRDTPLNEFVKWINVVYHNLIVNSEELVSDNRN